MMKRWIAVMLCLVLCLQQVPVSAFAQTEDVQKEPEGYSETNPVETEPEETDPIETEPEETDPIETEPEETEPKLTEQTAQSGGFAVTGSFSEEAELLVAEGSSDKADFASMFMVGMPGGVSSYGRRMAPPTILDFSGAEQVESYIYDIDLSGEHEGPVTITLPGGDIPALDANEQIRIVHLLDDPAAIGGAYSYSIGEDLSAYFPQETAASGDPYTIYYEILDGWRDGDGNVVFTTTSFSTFITYTVDFHFNGIDFSIPGEGEILLSDLFAQLEIYKDASTATSVVFSNPELVAVEQLEDDWKLISLQPFDTNETLVIAFSDGSDMIIDVTDQQYMGQPGQYHIYRLFGDRSDYYIEYNSVSKAGGSAHIRYHHYDQSHSNELANDKGTHYWALTSGEGLAQATTWYNTGSSQWYDIYSTKYVYMEPENRMAYQIGLSGILVKGDLYFSSYSTAISWTSASGATIDPNKLCSISVEPRVGSGTQYRTIQVYYNNKLAGTARVLFPVKNDTSDGYDERNALVVSEKDNNRYELLKHTVNFSGDGNQTLKYTYNYDNQTYRIDFYDYKYELTYDANKGKFSDGSSTSVQTAGPNSRTSYTFNSAPQPIRAGYQLIGWSDSSSATSNQYPSGITMTGTKSNTGTTITITKMVYAVWSPNSTTSYKVEHYQQNLEDATKYTLKESDNKTGTTGAKTDATAKNYSGFTAKSFSQVDIDGSGNTVVKIYYDRNTNTTYKVEHYQQNLDDTTKYTLKESDNKTGTTGAKTDATAKNYSGFTAKSFSQDDIDGSGNTVVKIYYDRNTNTAYTVKHYQQKVDGTYPDAPTDTDNLEGTTGAKVTPARKSYTGFTAPRGQEVTIAADGSTVVDYKYARNTYSVEFGANGGTNPPETQTKIYGVELILSSDTPNAPNGKKFDCWLGSDGKTYQPGGKYTGNAALTLTAQWTSQYKYKLTFNANTSDAVQNMPDNLAETDWLDGDSYTYTWTQEPTRTGYAFAGWSTSSTATSGNTGKSHTITGKAADVAKVTLYAIWTAENYTYNIVYESSTGVALGSSTETRPFGTTETIYAPAKDGYTTPAAQEVTWDSTTVKTVTFTYTPINYTVTYKTSYGTKPEDQEYTIEKGITLAKNPMESYSFAGWTVAETAGSWTEGNVYIDTITAGQYGNVTLVAKWNEAEIKIQHWKQNVAGGADQTEVNYTKDATVDEVTGVIGSQYQAPVRTYEGFTSPDAVTVTVADDGNVVNYYYTRNSYTLTLECDDGIKSTTGAGSYRYGADAAINADVKTGYQWSSWVSGTNEVITGKQHTYTMPASDVTLKATTIPNNNTTYTVKHYQQALDGTYPETQPTLTESKSGTTGQLTDAVAQVYEGFTVQSFEQIAIAGDGNTVVNIYYTRNRYDVTINHLKKGTDEVMAEATTAQYLYGETVTVADHSKAADIENYRYSYAFPATLTVKTSGNEATIYYELDIADYIVKHWQQNVVGDGYTEVTGDVQTLSGTIGQNTDAVAKTTYVGFTAQPVTQKVIAATGTEVNIYYNRNLHKVNYAYTGTVPAGAAEKLPAEQTGIRFGAAVHVATAPELTGYTFNGWNKSDFTMPDEDVTITGSWSLNIYKITYDPNGGTMPENPDDDYTVEDTDRTLPTPSRPGYTFDGWKDDNHPESDPFKVIPDGTTGNLELTAQWTAKPDTPYIVEHIFVAADGTEQTVLENKTGTTDTVTNEIARTDIPGYGMEKDFQIEQKTITSDEKAKVTIRYSEEIVQITYASNNEDCGTVDPTKEITSVTAGETNQTIDGIGASTGQPVGSTPIAKPGYKFIGWFTDANCTTAVTETEATVDENNKLTPKPKSVAAAYDRTNTVSEFPNAADLYENARFYAKFSAKETKIQVNVSVVGDYADKTLKFTGWVDYDLNQNTSGDNQSKISHQFIQAHNDEKDCFMVTAGKNFTLTTLTQNPLYTISVKCTYTDADQNATVMNDFAVDKAVTMEEGSYLIEIVYTSKDVPPTGIETGNMAAAYTMLSVSLAMAALWLASRRRRYEV